MLLHSPLFLPQLALTPALHMSSSARGENELDFQTLWHFFSQPLSLSDYPEKKKTLSQRQPSS